MPRPKGSKNKVKPTTPSTDFTSLIAEKSSTKEALVADIASLEENLTSIREELKAKKAELKKLDTELGKLEEQKAAFDAAEAEKAKKAELEEMIQKLMADGVSAAEILESFGEEFTLYEVLAYKQKNIIDQLFLKQLIDELYKALDELDELDRNLIDALYFEDMSLRQYAKLIGTTHRTISNHRKRILLELRKIIEMNVF